jgi:hypothetical protein
MTRTHARARSLPTYLAAAREIACSLHPHKAQGVRYVLMARMEAWLQQLSCSINSVLRHREA